MQITGKVASKREKRIKGKKSIQSKRKLLIIGIVLFSFCFSSFIYMWYHGNKPIFGHNYIKDDFDDQIPGIFPAGWLSAVHPLNVKVVSDEGNNVMEVRDTNPDDITEVTKRYKKTTEGIVKCKVKALDIKTGFVIHIPQTDKEYDPYDDIIIVFLRGGIYVIQKENIIEVNEDDSQWSWLRLTNDETWLIDEWNLVDYVPIMDYEVNVWYSVKIDFNRESFFLTINGEKLGSFNYPKYNPPYFASIYFWSLIEPSDFKFYVDDVSIRLTETVDYIHPLNIFIPLLLILFLSLILISYFKLKKISN